MKNLRSQLIDDFIQFGKGNSPMSPTDLQDACHTVEHLGLRFRDELISKVSRFLINPYQELFA